jgi:hemerythrin
MRPMRWKKKYVTGVTQVDARQQQVVTLLNGIAVEAERTEHCQDLNELYAHLTERTEALLIAETQSPTTVAQQLQQYEREVHDILATELPLPAKQGAACRHCGVCDVLEQEMRDWLAEDAQKPQ